MVQYEPQHTEPNHLGIQLCQNLAVKIFDAANFFLKWVNYEKNEGMFFCSDQLGNQLATKAEKQPKKPATQTRRARRPWARGRRRARSSRHSSPENAAPPLTGARAVRRTASAPGAWGGGSTQQLGRDLGCTTVLWSIKMLLTVPKLVVENLGAQTLEVSCTHARTQGKFGIPPPAACVHACIRCVCARMGTTTQTVICRAGKALVDDLWLTGAAKNYLWPTLCGHRRRKLN